MGFISSQASKQASGGGGQGGYLSVSKLGDGDSYKVAIVSPEPLEFFEVWGESADGVKRPFRFSSEPSAADIEAELGDFKQRMNYEQTALEAPKFVLAFFVYDHADGKIKVMSIPQKTVIKELDRLSQDEDFADVHSYDLKFSRTGLKMNTEYRVTPVNRKGDGAEIKAAWDAAQDSGYELKELLIGGSPFGS